MFRCWSWIPLFLVSCLAGCTALDSQSLGSEKFPRTYEAARNINCDLTDPVAAQESLDTLNAAFVEDLTLQTPRGSQIGLIDQSDHHFMGVLLSANSEEVLLMNCICHEAIPGPADQKQCKTSHVPFQSLKTSSLTHFNVISPPAKDFPTAEEEIDGSQVSVGEIVYRNGRRQAWGKPVQ